MELRDETTHRIKPWFADWRNVLVLVALAVYLLLACLWQNIAYGDESSFLTSGNHFHVTSFLTQISSAPLYALWYRLLSYVCPDAVHRYFLSWALLVVCAVMLPLLMRIGRAWVYAAVLLGLPFFSVLPYVSIFAAILLVAVLCIVLRREFNFAAALTAACATCFVVAFCRSEYSYGVFVSALAALVVIAVSAAKRSSRSTSWMAVTVLALSAGMLFVMRHSDAGGSGSALLQHSNVRAANLHDPRLIVLLLSVLGVCAWPWIKAEDAWAQPASLFVFLVSLPTVACCLLIAPQPQYGVIILPGLLLLALQTTRATVMAARWIYILTGGFALGILMVVSAVHNIRLKQHPPIRQPGVAGIECLRNLEKTDPGRNSAMFDPLGLPDVYFGESQKRTTIDALATWSEFNVWVSRQMPGWVLVNPTVPQQYHVSVEEIDQLLRGMGYVPHACLAHTALTVYVRR